MRNILRFVALSIISASLLIPISGCQNSPTTIAYKGEAFTITTVDAAMRSWADWVKAGHATQKQVDAVKNAYSTYYDSQMAVRTALDLYASDPTDSSKRAVAMAVGNVTANGVSLVSLISQTKGTK